MLSDSKLLVENAIKEDTENKIKLIKFASEERTSQQRKQDLKVKFDDPTVNAILKLFANDPKTLTTVLQSAKNTKTIEKERQKHASDRPYVGQILYSKCGYDCSLVSFYEVVKVTKCFVWVKEIKSAVTEDVDGYGQQVMKRPIKHAFYDNSKPMRRKICNDTYDHSYGIAISSYEGAYPWDGQDLYEDSLD